jgi:hypothetical protein
VGCDNSPRLSYWCSAPPAGNTSVVVELGQPAVAIGSSGDEVACALLADGSVKCWGGSNDCAPGNACEAPAHPTAILGGSVETQAENGGRAYAEWSAIDLGTHP